MALLLHRLSSLKGHEKSVCQVSQLLSGSTDLRNAGSHQKWLNVEIDNSVLRIENYEMRLLLHTSSSFISRQPNFSKHDKNDAKLKQKLRKWCDENPLDGQTLESCRAFISPEIEVSSGLKQNDSLLFNFSSKLSENGLTNLNPSENLAGYDEAASLVHYIILKAFICSSLANQSLASGNEPNWSSADGSLFEVTLLPTPLSSLEYTSFSSLILTASIYLNQLQSLISRLGKNFPKELKLLRTHIKESAGQNIDKISKQQENAEKFLNVLSNSEVASTLQKIADGYTKQFKRQRDKYTKALIKLQRMRGEEEEGAKEGCSLCLKCRPLVVDHPKTHPKHAESQVSSSSASCKNIEFDWLKVQQSETK